MTAGGAAATYQLIAGAASGRALACAVRLVFRQGSCAKGARKKRTQLHPQRIC